MTDSSQASASAPAREESDTSDHDRMLADLDVAIEEARRKVESGRVYDPENEKVRIKWIRALSYAVNVRRQVTADKDLEELAEEVAELKSERGGDR